MNKGLMYLQISTEFSVPRVRWSLSSGAIVKEGRKNLFSKEDGDIAAQAPHAMLSLDNLWAVESYWRLLELLS
jgi:hypothetical protein